MPAKTLAQKVCTPLTQLLVTGFAFTAFAASTAWGQDANRAGYFGNDWHVEIGAGAGYMPEYEGSDDYEAVPYPLVHISWRDMVTLSTLGAPELGVKFLDVKGSKHGNSFSMRALVGYYFGRDADDNDALKGLGDIDGGVNLGLAADYNYQRFGATLAVRQDVSGDREGLEVELSARYRLNPFGEATTFTFGPSVTWADADYMDNTFSISPAQAAASQKGYSAYSAGDGFKDAGLDLIVRHAYNENVSVLGGVSYKVLLSDAADSPIVDNEGSENQFGLFMGVTYTF